MSTEFELSVANLTERVPRSFLSVHQNEHLPFRHFASISLFLFAICLVFALVFIILTATHPAVSQAQCLGALRPANPSNGGGNLVGGSSNQDKVQMASNVCSIFAKIQLGVMSGVWLLVLLVQVCPAFDSSLAIRNVVARRFTSP